MQVHYFVDSSCL